MDIRIENYLRKMGITEDKVNCINKRIKNNNIKSQYPLTFKYELLEYLVDKEDICAFVEAIETNNHKIVENLLLKNKISSNFTAEDIIEGFALEEENEEVRVQRIKSLTMKARKVLFQKKIYEKFKKIILENNKISA